MKKEKLIFISCVVLFIVSVTLVITSYQKEKNRDDAKEMTEESTEESTETYWPEASSAPESEFKFDEVEFTYKNTGLDIKGLLEKNNQLNYFQLDLYEYLCEKGYEDTRQIEISDGKEDAENIQFTAYANTLDDAESLVIHIDYDTQMLAFSFSLDEEADETFPVNIIGLDSELESYIGGDLKKIERDFGKYLYEQKLDASQAEVKWYEKTENQLVIQVEIKDEYLTYCKIYYNTQNGEFEFKKWG